MAWFSRFTRFGDVHMVFGQESGISCGVACVIMAAFKINKFAPGVRAAFSEADVLARATLSFGPNPLGGSGLNNPQILQLLNHPDLKMPGWQLATLPSNTVPNTIVQRIGVTGGIRPTAFVKPMIVGIDWIRGGGHRVLVDTVRSFLGKTYATVCDPWDANVHIVPLDAAQNFAYTSPPAVAVDFGGTHYNYTTPSVGGCFIGDVLWRN